jgi:sirohydrochlorin cobaltochelatase
VARLAAAVAARHVVDEVGIGFLKGAPAIGETMRAFSARRIVVYPLFLADGYFTRVRLAQVLDDARREGDGRLVQVLPPLGLDTGLADLVSARAIAARGPVGGPAPINLILLAHGSSTDPASRTATECLAASIARRPGFRTVRCAFLDEPPSLGQATAGLPAPLMVFGLFAGDGMHGAEDVPRLLADLGRPDVAFAGTIASLDGIERLIATAVARAECSQVVCEAAG